jgi:hypothetical protein
LRSDELIGSLKSMLGIGRKQLYFVKFLDSSGNFELIYPKGWDFDHDIAVEDGRYTISFCSHDSQSTFTVAVDANLPKNFRFKEYAKRELEGPSAGIHAEVERSEFKDMPAYTREFSYRSGGRAYFGGGVMFYSGNVVFSISYNAPESRRTEMEAVFTHMKERFTVRQGFVMKNATR